MLFGSNKKILLATSNWSQVQVELASTTSVMMLRMLCSENLSINKICTVNASCSMQINETSQCDDGMTTSTGTSGTSACTTCCGDDACNVNSAPQTASRPPTTFTSLLASFVTVVVLIRAAHSLDDIAAHKSC